MTPVKIRIFTGVFFIGGCMNVDITPLIVGIIIFVSSIISLRLGLSVAIIEIVLGMIAGNFGIKTEEWMTYLAGFGGILLTFLAGTEIDTKVMKEKFKQSFLIGFSSFLIPFISIGLFAYYILHWSMSASMIAGTALSTTSLAVVYSVLVETNLAKTGIGKMLMSATFITDMGVALAMSILFFKPSLYTVLFIIVSIAVVILASQFSHYVFSHHKIRNKVIEPEIKYIFLLLLLFMYFANLGESHAVLPAFVLGLLMSRNFNAVAGNGEMRNRLRTVAYAIITPMFFITGGLKVSFPLIVSALGIFAVLFVIKLITKFIGVYFLAKKYISHGSIYVTLLMSTGLTFGTIASVFGLNSGIINQVQYSVLIGVVIASAVIPTFIAQRWFMPVHSEDVVEIQSTE
jgi:Kef-type K+ transport system membrane component KefB